MMLRDTKIGDFAKLSSGKILYRNTEDSFLLATGQASLDYLALTKIVTSNTLEWLMKDLDHRWDYECEKISQEEWYSEVQRNFQMISKSFE